VPPARQAVTVGNEAPPAGSGKQDARRVRPVNSRLALAMPSSATTPSSAPGRPTLLVALVCPWRHVSYRHPYNAATSSSQARDSSTCNLRLVPLSNDLWGSRDLVGISRLGHSTIVTPSRLRQWWRPCVLSGSLAQQRPRDPLATTPPGRPVTAAAISFAIWSIELATGAATWAAGNGRCDHAFRVKPGPQHPAATWAAGNGLRSAAGTNYGPVGCRRAPRRRAGWPTALW
jgi:hypothetical protein